jgi:hypothetical protein
MLSRTDRLGKMDPGRDVDKLGRYSSPGHHVDGGLSAVIFVCRNATKWLRLYGRP